MKGLWIFLLGTAFGSLAALGIVNAAGPETDPVKVSPDLYTVRWRGVTTHAVENVGNTEVHALAVEIKPCS